MERTRAESPAHRGLERCAGLSALYAGFLVFTWAVGPGWYAIAPLALQNPSLCPSVRLLSRDGMRTERKKAVSPQREGPKNLWLSLFASFALFARDFLAFATCRLGETPPFSPVIRSLFADNGNECPNRSLGKSD